MLEWLRENTSLVSALASLATVVIWLLYLQLFYREFRMRRRPHLVIKQGGGAGLDALCVVTNMSQHPADVMAVLIDVERGGERSTFGPAERGGEHPGRDDATAQGMVHAPLSPGAYLRLGTFRTFLEDAQRHFGSDLGADGELLLDVRVVAFVGAQQEPRGGRRRFRIAFEAGEARVRPVDVLPRQLASRRQRRLARGWLEEAQELGGSAVAASGGDAGRS